MEETVIELNLKVDLDKSLDINIEDLQVKVIDAMWWNDNITEDEHNFIVNMLRELNKQYAKSQI